MSSLCPFWGQGDNAYKIISFVQLERGSKREPYIFIRVSLPELIEMTEVDVIRVLLTFPRHSNASTA
jgi:hypothetical protein